MSSETIRTTGDGIADEREPPAYDGSVYERYEDDDQYHILPPEQYGWTVHEATRAAYADLPGVEAPDPSPERRYLKYHSEWTTPAQATLAVGVIDRYNYFRAENVAEALYALPSDALVSVGREGSPVLYVWTAEPVEAYDVFDTMAGAPDELGGVAEAETFPGITTGERRYKLENGTPTLIRAWWD